MAWTGQVILDADKPDVGVAIAIWNQGQADEFRYERRAQLSVTDRNKFVAEAKAALTAEQTKRASEATYAANLTTALNA